ncbi:MAG: hypothetical protein Q9220_004397, partial [cf. Caloplaca sp. 1 TL-2023]
AGMLAKTDPDAKAAGKWIVKGGLAIQLLFFGFFIIVSVVFYSRLHKCPTDLSPTHRIPWRRCIRTLYAASVLIMIRSVFRVVEYAQGNDGYLLRRELWLYIFDASLTAIVMLCFNVVQLSVLNRRKDKEVDPRLMAMEGVDHNKMLASPEPVLVHNHSSV